MAFTLTFSPREHKKLIANWQRYYEQLRLTFEPSYRVAPQSLTQDHTGQSLLLTSWLNGRATIMPPADFVNLIQYNPEQGSLRSYLIRQAELFEELGWLLKLESFPTRYFQIEALTEATAHTILPKVLAKATLVSEQPLPFSEAELATNPVDLASPSSLNPIPTPASPSSLASQPAPSPVAIPHRHRLA